jgi:cyclophilin family peptidyl-prolyl cis-trans isomerase
MKKLLSLMMLAFATIAAFANTGEEKMSFKEPKQSIDFEKGKTYLAIIHTTKGKITCQLYPEKAPISVTNFIQLSEGGFYNHLTFHRVEPNFVIQGGDPKGTGAGGPGFTLPAEISLPHLEGALAWARLPDQFNPLKRSSGSQFYITLANTPFLDNEYTVFGQTVEGMDVVKKIAKGDVIEKIEIVVK